MLSSVVLVDCVVLICRFWKWPWFVSFCCHVLCSLGRRFVSCDIVDVYSILLWCMSVIFGGGLLLSLFIVTLWETLIVGSDVFRCHSCVCDVRPWFS